MQCILRHALIWFMALAMPVQGMAASAMAFCGPAHDRVWVAAAGHDASAAPVHEHANAAHLQAAGALPDEGTAAAADVPTQEPSQFTQAGQSSCSACASCCSMLAIPVSFAPVAGPASTLQTPVALAVGVASFVTAGPERPPRRQHA